MFFPPSWTPTAIQVSNLCYILTYDQRHTNSQESAERETVGRAVYDVSLKKDMQSHKIKTRWLHRFTQEEEEQNKYELLEFFPLDHDQNLRSPTRLQ